MSSTETAPTITVEHQVPQDQPEAPDAGQAGGSPPPDERAEPENHPAEGAEVKELRQKLTQVSQNHQELLEFLQEQKDLWPTLQARATGQGPEAPDKAELTDIEALVDELWSSESAPQTNAGLKKLAQRLLSVAEQRVTRQLKPHLTEVSRMSSERQFAHGVRQAGGDPALLDDPDFQDHLKELKASKSFRRALAEEPLWAAKVALQGFQADRGTTADFARERRRVSDAKEASLSVRGSKSGSTGQASNRVKVRHRDGLRSIFRALETATPDQIDVE